jgi:hypothetical protein
MTTELHGALCPEMRAPYCFLAHNQQNFLIAFTYSRVKERHRHILGSSVGIDVDCTVRVVRSEYLLEF